MGKEASCRCLVSILEEIENKNVPQDIWLKGIPYSIDHLRNKYERIEWTVFCRIIKNIRPFFSEDDFIEMGRSWISSGAIRATRLIPQFLFERGELLHLAQRYIEKSGSQFFTCIKYKTTSLGPNGIRQSLTVKTDYEYCREFFLITKGALEIFFVLFGRATTSIEMYWIERGAAYEIICESGAGILSKIRKFITEPFTAREMARELEEANQTLLTRYQELERTQLILKQQTTELNTAFKINQAIRKNLDLDLVLDSIARAIVEVAGFEAAEININAESEKQLIRRKVSFGKIPVNIEPLLESLSIEDSNIGEIKAWFSENMTRFEASELLNQVVPTILMTIHDAITYNALLDYRNNLERKVEERTAELKRTRDTLARTVELLRDAQSVRDRFFTNISHEFRTPLTLILGPAKDIIDKSGEYKTKQNAEMIKRSATRLLSLVNQILDITKLEAGKMTLEISEQDIIPLLKELFISFAPLAERKKITFKFNITEENLYVYIDDDKIEKIIDNLLSNAFKFTPEGGRIELKMRRNEEYVEISIQDSGIGIPNEKISKIFDRFYQVDETHKREYEGTGIGLALSKELTELHKGKIGIESEEGKGTIVTISVPLGKKHYTAEEILKSLKTEKTISDLISKSKIYEETENEKFNTNLIIETEKPLILLVEDNSDVRCYIKENIENEYTVLEAVNGEEGFKKSIEQIPCLVISDIMMPKMDGFELCEKLKTDERTSHIPVILLTAKATNRDKITGYETGADDYIVKPFDVITLHVRIRNLIEQRKKLRQHFLQEGIFNLDNKNITSVDRKFLERAVKIINEHLSDISFGVESFAGELSIGRTTLYKKIVAMVGEPPGDFIKRIRLSKAHNLLNHKAGNISEIALEVGFINPAYFSECFKKQFGIIPSQYQSNLTNY